MIRFVILFFISFNVFAIDLGELKGLSLSKDQINSMIDMFVQTGRITKEQGDLAKKELASKSDKEVNDLVNQAKSKIESGNIPTLMKETATEENLKKMTSDFSKASPASSQDSSTNKEKSESQKSTDSNQETKDSSELNSAFDQLYN